MAYDATDFVVTETPVPVRDPKSITDPRERVAYLRDFLRALPPERFDMQCWTSPHLHNCRTPACIGGWAASLFAEGCTDALRVEALLGLSSSDGDLLFFPRGRDGRYRDATPAQAANVLDNYLAAGQIDWSVA